MPDGQNYFFIKKCIWNIIKIKFFLFYFRQVPPAPLPTLHTEEGAVAWVDARWRSLGEDSGSSTGRGGQYR